MTHLKTRFIEDGFVIIENVFTPEEINQISACFDRLQKTALQLDQTCEHQGSQFVVENQRIQRIVWACGAEPVLKILGEHKDILGPVSTFLGSENMDHLICQGHFKLPGDQVDFQWHQDAEHRRYGTHEWRDINGTGSYVQTIAAIDPMRSDNGPVMILPGSHKDGFLNLPEGDNRIQYVKEKDLVPVELAPGSVMFFGPYLIHGSLPNRSESPRRIFINGFSYPGANSRVYPGKGSGCRVIYTS